MGSSVPPHTTRQWDHLAPTSRPGGSASVGDAFKPGSGGDIHPIALFFGRDNAGQVPRIGDYPIEMSTLPMAYKGPSTLWEQVMIRSIESTDSWLLRDVCPLRAYDGIEIRWDIIRFDDAMLNRTPVLTSSRVLTTTYSEGRAYLVRNGIGIVMEQGFWNTPKGKEKWNMHIQQLVVTTVQHLNLSILVALITRPMKDLPPHLHPKSADTLRDLDDLFRKECHDWARVNKHERGLAMAIASAEKTFMAVNPGLGRGNIALAPPGIAYYAGNRPEERYFFLAGEKRSILDTEKVALMETMEYNLGEGVARGSPLFQWRTIGNFWLMNDKHLQHLKSNQFNINYVDCKIFSSDKDDWHMIPYPTALRYCGLWERTGDKGLTELGSSFFAGRGKFWGDYLKAHDRLSRTIEDIRRLSADKFKEFINTFHPALANLSIGSGGGGTTGGGTYGGGGGGRTHGHGATGFSIRKANLPAFLDALVHVAESNNPAYQMKVKACLYAIAENPQMVEVILHTILTLELADFPVNTAIATARLQRLSPLSTEEMARLNAPDGGPPQLLSIDGSTKVPVTDAMTLAGLKYLQDHKIAVPYAVAPALLGTAPPHMFSATTSLEEGVSATRGAYTLWWPYTIVKKLKGDPSVTWPTYFRNSTTPTLRGLVEAIKAKPGALPDFTVPFLPDRITPMLQQIADRLTASEGGRGERKGESKDEKREDDSFGLYTPEESEEMDRIARDPNRYEELKTFDEDLNDAEFKIATAHAPLLKAHPFSRMLRALYRKFLAASDTPWSTDAFFFNVLLMEKTITWYGTQSGVSSADTIKQADDLMKYVYKTGDDVSAIYRNWTEISQKKREFDAQMNAAAYKKLLAAANANAKAERKDKESKVESRKSIFDIALWGDSEIAELLDAMEINGQFPEWAIKNNFRPLVGILITRPHEQWRMGSLIYTVKGGLAGQTLYNAPNFMIGESVNLKYITAHFTFMNRTVVPRPSLVVIEHDVFCNGYKEGAGHLFWDPLNPAHIHDYSQGYVYGRSLFAQAVHLDEDISERMLDITGRFHPELAASEQRVPLHYSSAPFYAAWWKWRHGANPLTRAPYGAPHIPRWNTVCFQGTQWLCVPLTDRGIGDWDTRCITNKGHWGEREYPDCVQARIGQHSWLKPVNYQKLSTIAITT